MTVAVNHCDRLNQTGGLSSAGSGVRVWTRPSTVAVLLWLVLFAAAFVAILAQCDFRLIFTLDDAYIHLAVADQILAGGYGVNAGEYSSPSSSIIWPYFLALTEALHLGAFGPLLINGTAACATVFALLRALEETGLFDDASDRPFGYLIALILIFNVSAVALPMTGMEHSVHVWASIVTFVGLVAAARGRTPTPVHFIALVLLPLIRFEGAAFACAAIAGFALLGQRRFAASAALVIIIGLSGYFALMASRGLPLLPSSVLLKGYLANLDESASNLPAIVQNMMRSITSSYGLRLILLGLALAGCASWLRADRKALVVCLTVLAAIGAHLVFGQYGWFNRYEVYIMALAAAALLWGVAQVRPRLSALQWSLTKVALVLGLGVAAMPYATTALVTPIGASDIYEQQYQMARFAQSFYRRAVAVNDLGLVAYGNNNYALDLWGLGSEQVRKARTAGRYGPAEMAALASDHGVGLAMIYDVWFPKGVPSSWTKVAVLRTTTVTLSQRDVAFYRTPLADAAEVTSALEAFKATIPPRDRLDIIVP
ncbi:hypothetical protein [Bradyrhizobium sp. LTSP857]|uniref:hypothetical protein n=1 Tax=Bradyrhizobium sp. LTSP857 TaxID=1619231 RepID=UPI000A3DD753|nr:hypothetical protein [Bradyrhizobium sp. LTSP857]